MEKRLIAGILLFAGFIVSVATIMALLLEYDTYSAVLGDAKLFAAIQGVVAVIIIVGAMTSIAGRNWYISIVGAVLCTLSGGFYFIGSVLGLAALIILAISKDEFDPQVVYVDERAYAGGYAYDDGYEEQGWVEDETPPSYGEAPAITLVDQYGKADDHQYDGAERR
jgi:hypothetical protein